MKGGFAKALDSYGDATLKETFGEEQFKLLSKARDRLRFTLGGEGTGGNLFTTGFIFNLYLSHYKLLEYLLQYKL